METWWSSSSAAERGTASEAGAVAAPRAPRSRTRGLIGRLRALQGPRRWARLGLVLALVIVPGSINLAIAALPLLVGLGRLRGRRLRFYRNRFSRNSAAPGREER